MSATVEIPLDRLPAFISAQGHGLERIDYTVAMKRIAVLVSAATKENFAKGASPEGVPWVPLKRPRANSKGSDKPLRDKGLLMASVTSPGAGHVERITPTSLEYGTNLKYARIHQHGGTIRKRAKRRSKPWVFTVGNVTVFTRKIRAHTVRISQRKFLGWNAKLLNDVRLILNEYIMEVIAKLTGGRP